MKKLSHSVVYNGKKLDYTVILSKRKTFAIAVNPDQSVTVKAPVSISFETLQQKVKERGKWIKKQQRFFAKFQQPIPQRHYVGGETHLYLGRCYRLKIQEGIKDSIKVKEGYFYINAQKTTPNYIKVLLENWYKSQAEAHLTKIFEETWEAFKEESLSKPSLTLRRMKKSWGRCAPQQSKVTLNTHLVKAERDCIKYVITHEFCHLIHANHSSAFYKLLTRKFPDWKRTKHKLEVFLSTGEAPKGKHSFCSNFFNKSPFRDFDP